MPGLHGRSRPTCAARAPGGRGPCDHGPPRCTGGPCGSSSYLDDVAPAEVGLQVPVPAAVGQVDSAASELAHAFAHAREHFFEETPAIEDQDGVLDHIEIERAMVGRLVS